MTDEPIRGDELPDNLNDAYRNFARAINMLWPPVEKRITMQSPKMASEMQAYFALGGSMRIVASCDTCAIEFQMLDTDSQWRTFYVLNAKGGRQTN